MPRARLGERGLLAVEALVLVALAAGAVAGSLAPVALPTSIVARKAGVELRYPAGWGPAWTAWVGVFVSEKADRRGEASRREPCSAFVMRMSFEDFAELHHLATRRSLGRSWHDHEAALLSTVAARFRMDARRALVSVERVRIGSRQATMLASRCGDKWMALAVAPADDLVIAGMCAPTAKDLKRVWKEWMAMLAAARLIEPGGGTADPATVPCSD